MAPCEGRVAVLFESPKYRTTPAAELEPAAGFMLQGMAQWSEEQYMVIAATAAMAGSPTGAAGLAERLC
jgi:hypothetical protein